MSNVKRIKKDEDCLFIDTEPVFEILEDENPTFSGGGTLDSRYMPKTSSNGKLDEVGA
ncbi:MAG: hypothetical protein ACQEXB_27595 [Bacillota bacterium]